MTVLPLDHILESDQPIFGADLFNLAKLARLDYPVLKGFAISAPELELQTVLEHFNFAQREVFEQSLTFLNSEVRKITPPQSFTTTLKGKKYLLFNDQIFSNLEKLWLQLLLQWLEIVKFRLFNEGFNEKLVSRLPALTVFILTKKPKQIKQFTGYLDPQLKELAVDKASHLSQIQLGEFADMIKQGNKRLFLPQIYQFILLNGHLFITGVKPFTQTLPPSKQTQVLLPKDEVGQIKKSAVKLFLNLTSGFAVANNLDGVVVESNFESDFDTIVFKLVESCLKFFNKPVIFNLPDDAKGEIRGGLRLTHQLSSLDWVAEAIKFIRDKKGLHNLQIALPYLRCSTELLNLKKLLSQRGVHRRGSLKVWIELSVPENFINLESYLLAGFDGGLLNLDSLNASLGSYNSQEIEFYKHQVQTMIKFLKNYLKLIHKEKIPLLVMGKLTLHPDILDFLIEHGVWGVVANNPQEAENLPEHLHWLEKRMILKKVASI